MFKTENDRHVDGTNAVVDHSILSRMLKGLSDAELEQLEDELNFASFAGLPSPRILALLDQMIELDDAWKAQLQRQMRDAA
jgi:hypothetical protein